MRYFVIILFFIFSCKNTIDRNVNDSIIKILSENQKIHAQLIAKSDFIPDTTDLLASIKDAKVKSENNKVIQTELEKLEATLNKANKKDLEAFFQSISSFSERLSDILKVNRIQSEYNKFYCPMVEKYWIAKGEEIQNPYAPEMRSCGELVK